MDKISNKKTKTLPCFYQEIILPFLNCYTTVSCKIYFYPSFWISYSKPFLLCMLLYIRAMKTQIDVDKKRWYLEAPSQQSPDVLYWALPYILHVGFKSTQPFSLDQFCPFLGGQLLGRVWRECVYDRGTLSDVFVSQELASQHFCSFCGTRN